VDFESGYKKGKKKVPKKRCYHCFLSIEKTEGCDTCNDCKKWLHSTCLIVHNCDIYKLDDGLSMVSGMEWFYKFFLLRDQLKLKLSNILWSLLWNNIIFYSLSIPSDTLLKKSFLVLWSFGLNIYNIFSDTVIWL
jgi:hypothetical protein